MKNKLLNESALQLLKEEAEQITELLKYQEITCTSCPIVEEIMDTKVFGFSEKINFAIKLNIIEEEEGQILLGKLEYSMHQIINKNF